MTDEQPQSSSHDLQSALRGVQKARWATIWATFALLICGAVLFGVLLINAETQITRATSRLAVDDSRIQAGCAFWFNLATAPVTPPPGSTRPSLLGVKIISSSRQAYVLAGCPVQIGPPSASLVKWSRYYHISLRYP